jgi:hypothetical protein
MKRYRSTPQGRLANINSQKLFKYGLSTEQISVMYEKQQGLCPICKKGFRELVVDHCHLTGRIRALLCNSCNKGLGFLRDDQQTMQNAILYLEEHKNGDNQAIGEVGVDNPQSGASNRNGG